MERGAFVACGSVGRGFKSGRVSSGCPYCDVEASNPTPEGVGVNGGGFNGDSEAALRGRFGSGVEGSSGTTNSSLFMGAAGALLLRFLVAVEALDTYFASPFVVPLDSGVARVLLVEMRAERRRDIVSCLVSLEDLNKAVGLQ